MRSNEKKTQKNVRQIQKIFLPLQRIIGWSVP
jgi:hypothetical protein